MDEVWGDYNAYLDALYTFSTYSELVGINETYYHGVLITYHHIIMFDLEVC